MVLVRFTLALLLSFYHVTSAKNLTFADFRPCSITSEQMRRLSSDENIEPCLLYDMDPSRNNASRFDLVVTLLQVTSTSCSNHRDGAPVAVEKLDGMNGGRGFPIGFNNDFYVGFRLISAVVGNENNLGRAAYGELHEQVLRTLLDATQGDFRYIIGTCSGNSAFEREPARDYETVLMAQVGPPGFYTTGNPWVFGFHINSDEYTRDSVQQLRFYAGEKGVVPSLPVRIIYRTASEFFFSTCNAAIGYLKDAGFENIGEILYDPSGDHDEDGVENVIDEDFLISVADEICPPGSSEDPNFRPAIYMCVLVEQNVLLRRFRENGCLFSSLWMTPTGWTWAFENTELVPYFQGGGQWHVAFTFGDQFFSTGREFLEFNVDRVGYLGGFDMLVSYAIPTLFAELLQNTYRIFDKPDPAGDYADPAGREQLRRLLLNFRGDTIFGPVIFDNNQRNIGRGAAEFQWQMNHDEDMELSLVSPIAQAEAPLVLPAPSIEICDAGSFVNISLAMEQDSVLMNKCSPCPIDTFAELPNTELQCKICPPGSVSNEDGTLCLIYDDHLLTPGILSFGYIVMSVAWILGLGFLVWALWYREDPVVKLAQLPFLVGICIGAIISSSAILAFSQQAGSGEDETHANRGCLALPFLYSIGWILQYGCVCAKTMRLWRIVDKPRLQRVTMTKFTSLWVIFLPILLDLGILIIWTVFLPLEYRRSEIGRNANDGILVIDSVGRCRPTKDDGKDSDQAWIFIGCIIAIHATLMASTHWLLYRVRNVNDRYQEQKYLGMAAVFALEILVIGVPILIAAEDSVEATYFVICGIISLDAIGLLCFIFVPKTQFLRKGLAQGVTIGESILSETHKKAVMREISRQENSQFVSQASQVSHVSQASIAEEHEEAPETLQGIPEGEEDEEEEEEVDEERPPVPPVDNVIMPKDDYSEEKLPVQEQAPVGIEVAQRGQINDVAGKEVTMTSGDDTNNDSDDDDDDENVRRLFL